MTENQRFMPYQRVIYSGFLLCIKTRHFHFEILHFFVLCLTYLLHTYLYDKDMIDI